MASPPPPPPPKKKKIYKKMRGLCFQVLGSSQIFVFKTPLFNYEIRHKDTNEKVFELAHFSTWLQYPME